MVGILELYNNQNSNSDGTVSMSETKLQLG